MPVVVVRHVVPVDDLHATQLLDLINAFEARHEQPEREALLRTQRLAVHAVGDHAVVHRLGERNADEPLTSSAPSATIHDAPFLTPASLSNSDSGTPVHSAQLVNPWVS